MQPQQVAVLLNAFFARMADAIFHHDGTLAKFIGDSVLAIFGAPLDLPNHALNAVQAAQSMRGALAALNAERPEWVLRMRIAIHTGVALVGDIGSPKRREHSVLRDVVNTAARIEESVAQAGQIVISRRDVRSPGGQDRGAMTPPCIDKLTFLSIRSCMSNSTHRKRSVKREERVSRTYRLPLSKLRAAKRALGAATATETIERALDAVVFQRELVNGTRAMLGIEITAPDTES